MNKKGFTLVELLAVIAILAILVIIALPNVLSMFNQAKEDTFTTETKEMVKIAQQQYLATFGKWTYYAVEGSKDADGNAIQVKDCTSSDGPEFKKENGVLTTKIEKYCKINKEAGNLKSFILTFNKADGQVATVFADDGTYAYHLPYTEKDSAGKDVTVSVYDATKVKNNGKK